MKNFFFITGILLFISWPLAASIWPDNAYVHMLAGLSIIIIALSGYNRKNKQGL